MIDLQGAVQALADRLDRRIFCGAMLQLEAPEIDMAGIRHETCWLEEHALTVTVVDYGRNDDDEWAYHLTVGIGCMLRNVTLRVEPDDVGAPGTRVREAHEQLVNGPRWMLIGDASGAGPADAATLTGTVSKSDDGPLILEEPGGRRWKRLG